jgi:hypothetical protein
MDPLLILLLAGAAAFVIGTQQAVASLQPATPDPTLPYLPTPDPGIPTDPNTGAPIASDTGSPSPDPFADPLGWLDSLGMPVTPGNPTDPLLPQPAGPIVTGDPNLLPPPLVQTPTPGCGPDNPELCIPFTPAGGNQVTAAGGAWLPGDPHTYDNQIVYVCSNLGMDDVLAPYVLKAILQRETNFNPKARGDHATCLQVDPNALGSCGPYRGDGFFTGYASIGIAQVNRVAHADLAANYDLRDPNQCIYAAGVVLLGHYNPMDWRGSIKAYNGSGPSADQYAAAVLAQAQLSARSAGIAGV